MRRQQLQDEAVATMAAVGFCGINHCRVLQSGLLQGKKPNFTAKVQDEQENAGSQHVCFQT